MDPSYKEYYNREEIKEEFLRLAKRKEVQGWFNQQRGHRPDCLQMKGDLHDMIRNGLSSLHFSEELWSDPLALKPGMTKKQLDELRIGWDLLIDIDSKEFEYSRIVGALVVDALKFHGVKNISCKFSGNHGFHIGVCFESFPKQVNNILIKDFFPDGVRIVAHYLKEMIRAFVVSEMLKKNLFEEIVAKSGKTQEELRYKICKQCKSRADENKNITQECTFCKKTHSTYREESLHCPDCNKKMDIVNKDIFFKCKNCGVRKEDQLDSGDFDPYKLVDIDSVLISSRHMFRGPYSINEKSGLVSIPTDDIRSFNRDDAKIENVKFTKKFLDREQAISGEASHLLIQALDWYHKNTPKEEQTSSVSRRAYEAPKISVKEEFFPDCIKKLMSGVSEDGRKRGVFVLLCFLRHMGWSFEQIETYLLDWNKKGYEPLRDGYIRSQVSWFKRQKQNILPPNCSNDAYYKSMGLKCSEGVCSRYKNPVNVALSALKRKEEGEKKTRKKKVKD